MTGTIVIVDGDVSGASLAALWLGDAGFRVIRTTDAWAGQIAVRAARPDVVLLGASVPDLAEPAVREGLTAALARRPVPVIRASGGGVHEANQSLPGADVRFFLVAPYRREELLAVVSAVVEGDAVPLAWAEGTRSRRKAG